MRFKRLFNSRALALILAIGILLGVTGLVIEVGDTTGIEQRNHAPPPPLVSVEQISSGEQSVQIEAYAEVTSRWAVELKSEVDGVVVRVYDRALAGSRVSEGEPLTVIDDTRYQAALADAERLLREAELERERAGYATQVARRQFESAGKQPPNELALHLPQRHIADASVKAASARVDVAQRELDRTVIRAPYSGFIVERYVNPGQMLMTGDLVARLIDDAHYDLAVSISKSDWQRLDHPIQGQKVALYSDQGNSVGEAEIREGGGYLDTVTRHYIVHLDLQGAETSVLAGDFVRVSFQGRTEENTLSLPASALTADGSIWWVEDDSTLARSIVDVLSHRDDRVLVRAPSDNDQWHIVAVPLTSYLPGQRVRTTVGEAW
ncbi:efflux RND transporter periplasmic adaptor subunit [Halomonas llamarensis]|uniref:Efflux RND transporter periplasmic adaptor subunit n=1 Tax=Halomonas llamarensis TaxID=2945104 RepID=A0ABT0SQI3_9GAMM|nr:efflux RND transporter periplasmic adaptor subunit [Halomonas llamarensis]MCL7930093.1 efflux RND transporter periplasmic adaptor subunit [Halomonas llamarensis]